MAKDIIIAVLILVVLALVWVVVFDTNRFTVSRYEYKNNKIKKNFRAVVVADLHNKSYGPDNIRLLEAIDKEKPDLILSTGDIINGKADADMSVGLSFLSKLAEKYPVYAANGNHEMRMEVYSDMYGDKYERYTGALDEAGVKLLVNDRIRLEEYGVCIIGSELAKERYKRFGITPMEEGELEKSLGKPEKDSFNILLAHNPDYFKDYVGYGPQLVLSGHIHGGIVRVPFVWRGVLSPNVSFFPKYSGGEYHIGETYMIVSRGLGIHTIPVRMFNPGDLVVIDFDTED